MQKIEDKIKEILELVTEDVSYENLGGPTPSEVLKAPIDYAAKVQKATVPQAYAVPGVGEIGDDDASSNDDADESFEMDDNDDSDDDETETVEETFASLLARLAEEEDEGGDTSLDDDNGGEPEETLPTVDSKLDSPDKLVNKAPGIKVAESEDDGRDTSLDDDNGGEPEETLPGASIDSLVDSPEKLTRPAKGAKAPNTVVEDEDDLDDGDKDEDDDKKKKDEDMNEDLTAIFSGSKLSEAAKAKAATIFKASVARRVNEENQRVQRVATRKLKEAFEILKTRSSKKQEVFEFNLTGQVDRYLNYVVENWMGENRLAVEKGIRAELAESFITGLKNLFLEHYIEVPESKVDVVSTLGNKVTKLEARLNETIESNTKMRSSLNMYRKEEVIRAVSGGLADTQREKLAKLAEGVEYTTRKEFAAKLVSLKEAYFQKSTKQLQKEEQPLLESATTPSKKTSVNSEMALYTQTLAKMNKNQS